MQLLRAIMPALTADVQARITIMTILTRNAFPKQVDGCTPFPKPANSIADSTTQPSEFAK